MHVYAAVGYVLVEFSGFFCWFWFLSFIYVFLFTVVCAEISKVTSSKQSSVIF